MAAPSTPFPINLNTIKYGQDLLSRWLDDLFTEGVVASGHGQVTQNGAGTMSVDVAAGEAYCTYETPYGGKRRLKWTATNSGTVGAPNTSDNWTATFTAAHGTLPRIDRVVATVQDANLDATGQRRQIFTVVAGTATSGADLVNLNGAAAVPANSILLANVLVRAATTAILTADIDTTATVRPLSTIGGRLTPIVGMAELAEVTLTATAANIDIQSITDQYRHLYLVCSLRSTNATTSVGTNIRFNNDSAANYDSQSLTYSNTGNPTQSQANGATSGALGDSIANNGRANRFSMHNITVCDYANTTREKSYVSQTGYAWDTTQAHVADPRGSWRNTTAINRITITPGAGNWAIGTRVTLYGLN